VEQDATHYLALLEARRRQLLDEAAAAAAPKKKKAPQRKERKESGAANDSPLSYAALFAAARFPMAIQKSGVLVARNTLCGGDVSQLTAVDFGEAKKILCGTVRTQDLSEDRVSVASFAPASESVEHDPSDPFGLFDELTKKRPADAAPSDTPTSKRPATRRPAAKTTTTT